MAHRIVIEQNAEMKTRDGVTLRADVIRPDITAPVPAIVCRTPYDKSVRVSSFTHLGAIDAAAAGFAVVFQDIRGRFESDGAWSLMGWDTVEQDDGYDCVEWVAKEPWCNGRVGMMGGSYEALNAMAAAASRPPSLCAIAPSLVGGADMAMTTRMLEGIILSWSALVAIDVLVKRRAHGDVDPRDMGKAMAALVDPSSVASTLPLADLAPLTISGMPSYRDLTERILTSGRAVLEAIDHIEVPALFTTGWWDQAGGSWFFQRLRQQGASSLARQETRLIIGPWSHTHHDVHLGDLGFGQTASLLGGGIGAAHLAFFARNLCGDAPALEDVRYFLTGENAWRHAPSWPPPEASEVRFYLHAEQGANSVHGDGALSIREPSPTSASDSYTYDPLDPVPSVGLRALNLGGSTVPGPFDQSRVERRHDVLIYSTEPLARTVEVVGDPMVELFVATSATDTDFVVKLCDVDPDGTSRNIADGMVQLSWQYDTVRSDVALEGNVAALAINLGLVGHAFKAGNRIRLQVTSSAFPHFNRNLNTGRPFDTDAEAVVAYQTVYRGGALNSHLRLPVVRGEDGLK